MENPRRTQRKAFKGWRLPPDTVYVGRGSKWGNPFPLGHQAYLGKEWARDAYGQWLTSTHKGMTLLREHLHELRGKDLACWCKPGEPCHADLLLALANAGAGAQGGASVADEPQEKETAAPPA